MDHGILLIDSHDINTIFHFALYFFFFASLLTYGAANYSFEEVV